MQVSSMLNNFTRYVDYFLNQDSFKLANNKYSPDYVELIVNKSCFFKCKMCNIWNLDENVILNLEDADYFLWSLKKIVKMPYTIYLCGGETLTYKYLRQLIKKCTDYGFDTVITTNGYLINEKLVKKLTDAGLITWVLSLDSIDFDIHDTLRGKKGSGKKVVEGIDIIKKINPKAEVNINIVIMEDNLTNLIKTVEWANNNEKIGVIHLNAVTAPIAAPHIRNWRTSSKYKGMWPQKYSEVSKVIDKLINMKSKLLKLINSKQQLELFKRYYKNPNSFVIHGTCHMHKTISVDVEGSMYMCHYFGKIGNIKNKNFVKTWVNNNTNAQRKKIKSCNKNCKMLINCNYQD